MSAISSLVDYYAFERLEHAANAVDSAGPWDVLLSSYDETDRVQIPFAQVRANVKQWFVHDEFGFVDSDLPEKAVRLSSSFDPPDLVKFVTSNSPTLQTAKVCVDATGFIRPHLLVLLRALRDIGVRSFDVLYSDPVRYVQDEHTKFTTGPVVRVEQVPGYRGVHTASIPADDILVIGAGYDYQQIARACEQKRSSKKYILAGLPSLQPHMYQESRLRIQRASEWIGDIPLGRWLYASANHPFATAQVLQGVVRNETMEANAAGRPLGNLYLCPVGPKPHLIGFAICYLRELEVQAASVIYPFAESYSRLTTQGVRRTWQYRIEL